MLAVSPQNESGGTPAPGCVVPPPVPNTWNSHSETPYGVARAVVATRTYRPAPVTFSVCVPPVPVVVWYTVDHADPLSDTWIW
jgi:hypothetical protein